MFTKEIKTELDFYRCIVNDLNKLMANCQYFRVDNNNLQLYVSNFAKKITFICQIGDWNEKDVLSMIRFFIKNSKFNASIVMVDDSND